MVHSAVNFPAFVRFSRQKSPSWYPQRTAAARFPARPSSGKLGSHGRTMDILLLGLARHESRSSLRHPMGSSISFFAYNIVPQGWGSGILLHPSANVILAQVEKSTSVKPAPTTTLQTQVKRQWMIQIALLKRTSTSFYAIRPNRRLGP